MLQELVERLNQDHETLDQIYTSLAARAKNGDQNALDFIGKYLLGGGKISLDDLYSPPVIRKGRR
jgi:hypothetical protein